MHERATLKRGKTNKPCGPDLSKHFCEGLQNQDNSLVRADRTPEERSASLVAGNSNATISEASSPWSAIPIKRALVEEFRDLSWLCLNHLASDDPDRDRRFWRLSLNQSLGTSDRDYDSLYPCLRYTFLLSILPSPWEGAALFPWSCHSQYLPS